MGDAGEKAESGVEEIGSELSFLKTKEVTGELGRIRNKELVDVFNNF